MSMWKLRIFANLPCYWLINIFWLCPVSVLVSRANIVFLLDRWGGHRKLGDFVSITSRTNYWAQESNLQILGSIAYEEWCHLLLNQIDSVIWHNSMDTILEKRQNDIIITSFKIWYVLVTWIIIHGWNVLMYKSRSYWWTWSWAKLLEFWSLVGAKIRVWVCMRVCVHRCLNEFNNIA